MVQRFSSREEARDQAIEQQRQEEPIRWPRGPRYNDFPEPRAMIMNHAGMWIYRLSDVVGGTAVVMHRPNVFLMRQMGLMRRMGLMGEVLNRRFFRR